METTPLLEKKRYHDLDALRAVAMLLGILLHGAISFMREPFWPIQDSQSLFWGMPEGMQEVGASMGMELPKQFSPYKFFFMQLVHGFRMPLFFVASGFFAAIFPLHGPLTIIFSCLCQFTPVLPNDRCSPQGNSRKSRCRRAQAASLHSAH